MLKTVYFKLQADAFRYGTVLACPIIVSFRELEQQAHFLLQVVARVNQVVASV